MCFVLFIHPFIYVCVDLQIYILFFGLWFNIFATLLLTLSRLWPLGALSDWLQCFFSTLCPWVFVSAFLLSSTAGCSRLNLYFLFPCPRICHFCKKLCVSLLHLEQTFRVFKAVKILCIKLQCWICHYKCVQTHGMGNTNWTCSDHDVSV